MRFSGASLRRQRESAGLSRELLALTIGRSYAAVAAYERGDATPGADMLAKLAAAVHCQLTDLYVDDQPVSAP